MFACAKQCSYMFRAVKLHYPMFVCALCWEDCVHNFIYFGRKISKVWLDRIIMERFTVHTTQVCITQTHCDDDTTQRNPSNEWVYWPSFLIFAGPVCAMRVYGDRAGSVRWESVLVAGPPHTIRHIICHTASRYLFLIGYPQEGNHTHWYNWFWFLFSYIRRKYSELFSADLNNYMLDAGRV